LLRNSTVTARTGISASGGVLNRGTERNRVPDKNSPIRSMVAEYVHARRVDDLIELVFYRGPMGNYEALTLKAARDLAFELLILVPAR